MIEPEVNLDEIQADVTPGLNAGFRQFVFLVASEAERLRTVLAKWLPAVTYASDDAFAVVTNDHWERLPIVADASAPPMVNIGISARSMRRLTSPERVAEIPDAPFRAGMGNASGYLGDPDADTWTIGSRSAPLDAVFVLDAPSVAILDETVDSLQRDLDGVGSVVLGHDRPLTRPTDGREPFGFADGLSQPALLGRWRDVYIAGRDSSGLKHRSGKRLVWPGHFLLGLPRSADEMTKFADEGEATPPWLRNSSLMVWRKLEQDRDGFAESCRAEARAMGIDEELAAARRVGRWRNGTALVTNPTRSGDVTTALDDFNFDDDRDGSLCPFPAHIRRMNPRLVADDSPDAGPFLLRRGIPYGTEGSDGGSRHGLVFVAYQSSIGGQFEYLQRLRGVRTDLSGQSDGLLGVTAGPAAWPGKPARSRWVTPRGGEYFLVPSRSLLAKIAAGGDPRVMASR